MGGVEKVMFDLTSGLAKSGIDCDMLCADLTGKKKTYDFNKDGAHLICTPTLTKRFATCVSPAMVTKLRKICRNYDIIHVHHPDPMAATALFLSGYKGKVVLHWHSDILKQHYLLKLYLPLQNWLINRADVIVGTTPVYVEKSPHLVKAKNKLTSIPIGINPIVPDSQKVKNLRLRYKGKKIVFSLGRLIEYKGYKYLIEAASMLPDDYIVLIGGEGKLHQELQNTIDEMQLQNKAILLGRVPDEDLPTYFGACDLFCLSSIYKTEAFAIVQVEAMSCGKPVVATNIPCSGVSWVNQDGVSGINVEPCNAKALSEAILHITETPELYKKLSQGAFERYQTCFTREKMLNSVEDLYQRLLG